MIVKPQLANQKDSPPVSPAGSTPPVSPFGGMLLRVGPTLAAHFNFVNT